MCAGGGMSHEEIALALGISRPTLEKHFEHELSIGAYQRRAEVLTAMHKAATKKGNVAAQKAFLAMGPELAAPPAPQEPAVPAGKKEQAQVAAERAAHGTEWHDDLPQHQQTTRH